MKKYFFTLALIAQTSLQFSLAGTNESKEFDAAQTKKLEIKNPKGEVTIIGNKSAKKVLVSIEKIQFDQKCKFHTELVAGLLKVSVEHESGLFEKANCVSKIKIEAPATISEVEVSTGSGHIKMLAMDSAVDFKTATGNVEIKADTLKGVAGKTATGVINLTYANCPKRADIDLISATGDAEIHLGSNCKIRVTHKSATGELFNEMGDSEEYQVLVNMKSASGNLKIKKMTK